MKSRSRLKHAAAGLLGWIVSRNNDVNGYWAPGLLYRDVLEAPHVIELNLLRGTSRPDSDSAKLMAAYSATFLNTALQRQKFSWEELTQATITLQFNADEPDPYFYFPCGGEPFICAVALVTAQGHAASVCAMARCHPYRLDAFTQSALPGPRPPQRRETCECALPDANDGQRAAFGFVGGPPPSITD